MTNKEIILRAMQELPDDATAADAIEVLYVLHKVEKGIRQADLGRTFSHDEARHRTAVAQVVSAQTVIAGGASNLTRL